MSARRSALKSSPKKRASPVRYWMGSWLSAADEVAEGVAFGGGRGAVLFHVEPEAFALEDMGEEDLGAEAGAVEVALLEGLGHPLEEPAGGPGVLLGGGGLGGEVVIDQQGTGVGSRVMPPGLGGKSEISLQKEAMRRVYRR